MTRRPSRERRGFALLSVLSIVTGLVVLGALASRIASESLDSTRNRVDAVRATWRAEGCLAVVRARADERLRASEGRDSAWSRLDAWLRATPIPGGCAITLVPTGIALDVNAASAESVARLLAAEGVSRERADSLAAALDDWRDADDDDGSGGSERAWYAARRRTPPRNAPLAARDELRQVRGWEQLAPLDSLLDVESGRILLSAAPPAVLSALPGMSAEAVARIVELRRHGAVELHLVVSTLGPDARRALESSALQHLVTNSPDAWILSAAALRGEQGAAVVELRLVRSGTRAAIVHHRSRPWS